jgi:thiol-disulfide isomerase/thioredoxin
MVAKRSTKMGKVVPYVDVRSEKEVPQFESMIKTGPVYVLVYADWCGHCQRFKQETWDDVAKSNNKKVNTAALHYDMVNKTSMKNAKIEGYPTLFEVKPTPTSNVSNAIPTPQNKEDLEKLVGTNEAENLVESLTNNTKSQRMMTNSTMASAESFEPAAVESLPPDTSADSAAAEPETVVRGGGLTRGGSLLESLLKMTADTAHVAILAASASEMSSRMKKRPFSPKGRRVTRRKRSGKKKQTRRR